MIPDLGKYETTVLAAYAISIVLILALVVVSLIRAARVKRQLAELEARRKKNA
ncbi:MAG: heme exporter protein CcmD [Rhodobacterales bacterium]|jgi:heme exporter protein D|nr:heme exporter protein CcmD [Pseudomonadota bacterium]MDA1285292.1 heme exporter protein CcmD [Pseudomonadota bacterium]NQW14849.1 heme exporter protein CcmD [Rhodobacter sp.]